MALDGWLKVRDATLSAAEATGSSNPHIRLNAMERGYLRWALNNRALFRAINHPDVNRQASDELSEAVDNPILFNQRLKQRGERVGMRIRR